MRELYYFFFWLLYDSDTCFVRNELKLIQLDMQSLLCSQLK